ncbi:MAG: flagellar basal body P-ring protein FlgI [Campylobacteraceae bacterium]|nr:flagellar basal body P-ring protein FlgI [Campylobacteraceae bacterium]
MKYFLMTFLLATNIYSQTIKDITNVVGIRSNQLLGYGLVVGLAGTGDKSSDFTKQSLENLLRNSYIKIADYTNIKSNNIAAVMVTSSLPAFSRQGDKIKVKISAIGDAGSINHGQLLLTQLKAVNGKVYAIAQGTIIANENNETTGYIYQGATIENEIPYKFNGQKELKLSLLKSSAKYADLVETKINKHFGKNIAYALDTRTIQVKKPNEMSMVKLLAIIQNITIDTSMRKRVIIDINTQTIIAGANIYIQPVTIVRDNFTLRIKKTNLSNENWENDDFNKGVNIGDNVTIGDNAAKVDINNALINTKELPTISDLVRAMKVMKLPITDIINTIKMIKDMGALDIELEIRG